MPSSTNAFNEPPPPGPALASLKKILFLSLTQSFCILKDKEWDAIKLPWLEKHSLFSDKDLRVACSNRGLKSTGMRPALIGLLINSIIEQRAREARQARLTANKVHSQLRMLGGCFTWGQGRRGQLGHGGRWPSATPLHLRGLSKDRVMRVFTGYDSNVVFAVTRTEQVWVWGASASSGLRRDPGAPPPVELKPRPLEVHPEPVQVDVDADVDSDSEDETDLLSPVMLEKLSREHVADMGVGRHHVIAVTKHGDAFAWGHNQHGQLGYLLPNVGSGIGKDEEALNAAAAGKIRHCAEPTLVRLESATPAAQMSVGTDTTMLIDQDGELMVWGASTKRVSVEVVRRSLRDLKVRQLSCGATHCCLLSTDSVVFTWGAGDGGRLGHGDTTARHAPAPVAALLGECVAMVSCSVWHSAAIVTVPPYLTGGIVYTFGTGYHGQLGLGTQKTTLVPKPLLDLYDLNVVITHVSCGMYHNAAISTEGKCLTWGSNVHGCLGRPEEMRGLPTRFTPVPGYVEGLDGLGLGPVDSVCAGRHYTVCCLGPYSGPSLAEKEADDERRKRRREAIQRALEEREALLAAKREKERIRQRKRRVALLNERYPGCSVCGSHAGCPGFQPDAFRPTFCTHCGHERDAHDRLRVYEDPTLTDAMLEDFEGAVDAYEDVLRQDRVIARHFGKG